MLLLSILLACQPGVAPVGPSGPDAGGPPGSSGSEAAMGGQTGEEFPVPCDPRATALSLDTTSPLGVSPSGLVAALGSPPTLTLSWADAPSTGLQLGVTISAAWWVDEAEGEDLGVRCADHLDLPGTLTARSEDGVLDEVLAVSFRAESQDMLTVESALSPSMELLRAGGVEPDAFTQASGSLTGAFEEGSSDGEIALLGLRGDGSLTELLLGAWAPSS